MSNSPTVMIFDEQDLRYEQMSKTASLTENPPTKHDEVAAATAHTAATMRIQSVPINVYESTGALVVVSPLPAVTADDVTVELRRDTLHFFALLRSAGPRTYLVHEWEYGGFEREIDVPYGFGSGVEATLANGQLVVRILRGEFAGDLSVRPTTP
jgi:HSP20 family molecular chaperone IbpA